MKFILTFIIGLFLVPPNSIAEEYSRIQNSKYQRYSEGSIDRTKEKEYKCLVSLLWFEARGETIKGIKYVMSVVENRKENKRYPDSYCDVMFQPKQFSFVHERLEQGLSLKVIPEASEKKKFDFIRGLAYSVIQGKFNSYLPSNILHYTKIQVNNYWTRKMKVYTVEGNHKFLVS